MLRFRRTTTEPRLEILPLIDVIFLVLTFFIYAMVLMIPAKVLPMQLQAFAGGMQGEPRPAVTVSIAPDGRIALDREEIALGELVERVKAAVQEEPETIIYVTWSGEPGGTDRLPVFGEVLDKLSSGGLDVRIVGRPETD